MKFKVTLLACLLSFGSVQAEEKKLSDEQKSTMTMMMQHWHDAKIYCGVDSSIFEADGFGYNPFSQKFEANLEKDSRYMSVLRHVFKTEKRDAEDFLIRAYEGDAHLLSVIKTKFMKDGGKFAQSHYKLNMQSDIAQKYYADSQLRRVILDSFYTQKDCSAETLEADRVKFKEEFKGFKQCRALYKNGFPFARYVLQCDGKTYQDLIADQSIWKKAL